VVEASQSGESGVLFIPGYRDIASQLANAECVLIEVAIYQQGQLMLNFDVEGFWF